MELEKLYVKKKWSLIKTILTIIYFTNVILFIFFLVWGIENNNSLFWWTGLIGLIILAIIILPVLLFIILPKYFDRIIRRFRREK